jgi:hypothetical protein
VGILCHITVYFVFWNAVKTRVERSGQNGQLPTAAERKYLIRLMLVTIAIGNAGHVFAPGACFSHSFTLNSKVLTLCFMYNRGIAGINIFGVANFARL